MKKAGIALFVIMFALVFCTIAQADTAGFAMEPSFVIVDPGTEVQFTYSVPEGYAVESEEWHWAPSFTTDGSTQTFLEDKYGAGVVWDDEGRITLPEATMVRVQVCLNGSDYIYGYVAAPSPSAAFTYTVTDGNATITGRDDSLLTEMVIIPPVIDGYPVTAIGDKAFRDLPSGVGGKMFIPDSVLVIGEESFAASAYMNMVYLSRNLTKMGEGAFGACLQLLDIRIPSSLTEIPDEAFANCWMLGLHDNLRRYTGSNTVRIGDRAFVGCYALKSGDGQLSSALTEIGEGAFWACTALTELTLPDGIDRIGDQAFMGCESLASMTFKGEVVQLGASAFEDCVSLTALDLMNVRSIGSAAMRGCTSLSTISLGSGLTYIGNEAFYGCTGVTEYVVSSENTAYTVCEGALMTKDETRLLAYPSSASVGSFTAPLTMTEVDDGAFHSLRYLKEITLPEGFCDYSAWMFRDSVGLERVNFPEWTLADIPEGFFYGCTGLVYPTEFAGVSNIGREAFRDCVSLPSVAFDDQLSSVGAYAFAGCTQLESAVMGQYTSSLGTAAFSGCTKLSAISLPVYLYTLPSMAFQGCSSLETVGWNDTLEEIGSSAFEGTAIKSLALPLSVTTIGSSAFAGNATLTTIVLHEGLTHIGTSAFAESGITAATLPESLVQLGNAAFMNCASLESVSFNSSLTAVPLSCLEGCTSLVTLEFPDSTTTIEARALAGCSALERLIIPSGVSMIASDAFTGCTALTIVGWNGSGAQTAAEAAGIPFEALDTALTYELNATGDGYLVASCGSDAYMLAIPASYEKMPVTGIKPGAFAACTALSEVTVDADNEYLSAVDHVLYSADGATLLLCPANYAASVLHVPETVTTIGDYAFAANRHLAAVYIGDQVLTIGANAFSNVNSSLTLFADEGSAAAQYAADTGIPCITTQTQFTYRVVDEQAWITAYTGTDTRVSIPDEIDGYPVYALESLNCSTVQTLIVGDSVEVIANSAFFYQEQLQEVYLGRNVRSIGASAFRYCTALTEIVLPDSLTTIGANAFSNSGLVSLCIPAKVSSIGGGFISGCASLNTLYVDSGNTCFVLEDGMLYDLTNNALIFCLPGLSGQVTIRDGIETIGSGVFKGFKQITSVTLPDSLLKIDSEAFSQCSDLISVTLPERLKRIGDSAFSYCSQLTEIELPESLEYIGDSAFAMCISLTEVEIPQGVSTLYGTFCNCYALTYVELPEGLTGMYNGVFEGCRSLKSLHLPATLTELRGELPPNLQTITIASGSGIYQMQNGVLYDTVENVILFVNDGVQGEVVILDGTSSIGSGAFMNCTAITSVVLPEGVTEIGSEAFSGCTALESVDFPDSLVSIGSKAFRSTGLLKVELTSGSLHRIAPSAFAECTSLAEVNISAEGVLLDEYLFSKCTSLHTAVLPKTVGRMNGGMFENCTALERVTLPQNITSIHGFENCVSLASVTIPDTVTTIQDNTFAGCESLVSVTIPDGVTSIGNGAFARCFALQQAELPDGLTMMGNEAFCATAIQKVTIPDGLTDIPDNAFIYCDQLVSVTIPDTVTRIGHSAFEGCIILKDVDLPAGLIVLGERAFYESALTMAIIPEGVQEIGSGAFSNCTQLETVALSVGVERINANTFSGCTSLTDIHLPNTVVEIGMGAFSACTALTKVTSDDANVVTIGSHAFSDCPVLTEVTVSDQLSSVGKYAFYDCTKLKRVSSSASLMGAQLSCVRSIGANAFAECKALPGVVMGDALESVGEYAFDSTTFTSISFPDGLTSIGRNAIWRNPYLTYVHLPASLVDLPDNMFSSTNRLDSLALPAGLKSIGAGAFYGNTSLGALELPEGLESIGSGAFQRAELMLLVPDSVTSIADDAFVNAKVEFYCSADSYAAQYADAHGITIHTDQSIPDSYLSSGAEAAAVIVAQVITDDMTDYQKAEALVDWMLANVVLDDNVQDTISSKQSLIMREASRWGWSYGYKELLKAAGLTTDVYHTSRGYIEGEAISSSGAITITYFDGEAVNMIKIDGEWYFTHPAFTEHFGKADYFMLNRDRYYAAFGQYPEVPDCDGYEQTYLYQEFSREIEEDVTAYASKEFEGGQKLVYAGVETEGVPYVDAVLDYAGMHMDTLEWQFVGDAFEPCIVGTETGFWLSGDLTGEYAEVTVDNTRVNYGDDMTGEFTYTAELCGLTVEGELTLEESTEEELSAQSRGNGTESNPFTQNKTYLATFTPMLSAYIDTLEPTTFILTVECVLPALTEECVVTRQGISISLAEDHVFPENAQLDIAITYAEEGMEAVHIIVQDTQDCYTNGVYEIPFDAKLTSCLLGCTVSIQRTADGCSASEPRTLASFEAETSHTAVFGEVTPASDAQDGYIDAISCSACGMALHPGTVISSSAIMHLPSSLLEIEAEAFVGVPGQQVVIPAQTKVIGSSSFANCTELTIVQIPDSVTTIAVDAFSGSPMVIILCNENSAAHSYAEENGLLYVLQGKNQ